MLFASIYHSILNMENLCILIWFQDFRQMLPIRIGNENLPELIALYHFHDSFHPLAVETVEDVV